MKRIFKYATGESPPKGAIYLCTIKNGIMNREGKLYFVWHYFLVEVDE